ncbi:MAG: hypothetical protein V3S43_06330 [Acidimicrobiia bacterium]
MAVVANGGVLLFATTADATTDFISADSLMIYETTASPGAAANGTIADGAGGKLFLFKFLAASGPIIVPGPLDFPEGLTFTIAAGAAEMVVFLRHGSR